VSESGAFKAAYNVLVELRAPMFFAVWKHVPIKTTLLRELEEVCDVTYREFEDPEELRSELEHFFSRIAKAVTSARRHFGDEGRLHGEWLKHVEQSKQIGCTTGVEPSLE